LSDCALLGAIAVTADEVVAAQVGVVTVVGQQVPGNDQDRVADGEGGLPACRCVWPAARTGPPGRCRGFGPRPRRTRPGPHRASGCPGGSAGAALAAGHVVARAASGPGGQVGAVGNTDMSTPDLGDDALGGPPADPGVEAVTGPSERGDDPVDRRVEFGDGPLQLLDMRQGQPQQQAMVSGERPRSAWRSSGSLSPADPGPARPGPWGRARRPAAPPAWPGPRLRARRRRPSRAGSRRPPGSCGGVGTRRCGPGRGRLR
jgi:hypothetical protein